ncbi:unnamed protein product [Hydatigera taeniaeformis]|uniref:Uncharacterized protein n=1 Tax=Hydatigena taeniaeformis TaxID=6205 RepID=A0A0R3WVD1_HYDTA|nr:unnamed protein product [Hydatigera taeniaeformis]
MESRFHALGDFLFCFAASKAWCLRMELSLFRWEGEEEVEEEEEEEDDNTGSKGGQLPEVRRRGMGARGVLLREAEEAGRGGREEDAGDTLDVEVGWGVLLVGVES